MTFERSEFQQNAYFDNVTFGTYVSFTDTKFNSKARFTSARFEKGGEFVWTNFEGPADFRRIIWSAHAPFSGVVFKDETNFSGSTFEKTALFDGADFGSKVLFTFVNFDGGVAFNGSKGKGLLDLTGSRLERVVGQLKASGLQDDVVIETLKNIETNYRKLKRPLEANQIAAERFPLELTHSEFPGWFQWLLKLLLGVPSKYGTDPTRLLVITMMTFLLPTVLLRWYKWNLKKDEVPGNNPRWAREEFLKGIVKAWGWILSINAILFLSNLFSTEAAAIYNLLSPLGK